MEVLRRHPALWSTVGVVALLVALMAMGSYVEPNRPQWASTGLGLLVLVLGAWLALVATLQDGALPVWTAVVLIPAAILIFWALFVGIG
jgi:hypothetical protein